MKTLTTIAVAAMLFTSASAFGRKPKPQSVQHLHATEYRRLEGGLLNLDVETTNFGSLVGYTGGPLAYDVIVTASPSE